MVVYCTCGCNCFSVFNSGVIDEIIVDTLIFIVLLLLSISRHTFVILLKCNLVGDCMLLYAKNASNCQSCISIVCCCILLYTQIRF